MTIAYGYKDWIYGVLWCLQVIPIEGDFEVNDERQKTYEEILPEIVISK